MDDVHHDHGDDDDDDANIIFQNFIRTLLLFIVVELYLEKHNNLR